MGYFTKGDRDDVVSRINQVHTITLFCPLNDSCVFNLRCVFDVMIPDYMVNENEWRMVPAIDALNCFIASSKIHDTLEINTNKDIIGVMVGSLKMFSRLKYINFIFTNDEEINNAYVDVINRKKDVKKYIYKIDSIEMNLSDMFSKDIIDLLNKIFIYNEIIPNSYLDRKFILNFKFDEYIGFMSMFISNNKTRLDSLDTKICEYFHLFPKMINEHKPEIRLITNYSDI